MLSVFMITHSYLGVNRMFDKISQFVLWPDLFSAHFTYQASEKYGNVRLIGKTQVLPLVRAGWC